MHSFYCSYKKSKWKSLNMSTSLNNSLDAHQYPLPIPEDLFTKLNGGIFFPMLFSNFQLERSLRNSLLSTPTSVCSDLTILASESNQHQPYSSKQWTTCWPDWQKLQHILMTSSLQLHPIVCFQPNSTI